MKLTVIILNYNVSYFLRQCILSVQEAIVGIESEIIVVDNHSQDGSCEMLSKNFPQITLIKNKENLGFSKANNQGVALAKGEYICILNPDTAVAKETFPKLLKFAEEHPDFGAIGAKLIDGTGNFLPESKRNIPKPKVAFYKMIGLKNNKNSYYANQVEENQNAKVDILVGAFMLLKKDRYIEVGGFDEDYFMYGEDIDLSYKLLKKGYINYYFGETTVLHYKGESTNKDKKYIQRFYGAMRVFYRKHFQKNTIFKPLVFFGVAFAKAISMLSIHSKNYKREQPKIYYILSDNISFLKKLSDASGVSLKSISKSSVTDGGIYNSQLIFDANYISYNQIFKTMQALKNKENTFRIRPINCEYLIGSDSSNTKGEIFSFSKT
ncbi:MAG: glycosyl transferase family 2 [Bacteroidetes bacterium HGW-Bacteroidetes-2]|jgi:GT2 family glycosyltransferase|nr:MAG: glycosyl transferase family 2 [Bacteroidetes bacterium HGW-Bacteroidetes-2]